MKPWEVMRAFDEGSKIEYRRRGCSDAWIFVENPTWAWDTNNYRVKPTPKPPRIEPFTFETFPRGAWVRINGCDLLVFTVQKYGVKTDVFSFEFCYLRDHAKLLVIENGKVVAEKPCGVEVRDE